MLWAPECRLCGKPKEKRADEILKIDMTDEILKKIDMNQIGHGAE